MKKTPPRFRPEFTRHGAAMVLALLALLVASMMIAALMRTAAMSHRQLKRDEFRLQASLLADAGCERNGMSLRNNWHRNEPHPFGCRLRPIQSSRHVGLFRPSPSIHR
jgi:type II secretory pathway component PulK